MEGGDCCMALMKWHPWNISSLLDEDWDFPTPTHVSRMMSQGLNIYETENEVVAEMALPGISEDKVDVSIDDGVVRISASNERSSSRKNEQKQEEKNQRKYFMSSMAQSYNYSFRLPDGLVADQDPQAVLKNGVLTLQFKKAEQIAPKKIKVVGQKTESIDG